VTGWHHLYLGIGLLLISVWIITDDLYQHWRQKTEPGYASPLHRWYIKYLYGIKWVRALNDWLDRILKGE
jgi:hypothetical protein